MLKRAASIFIIYALMINGLMFAAPQSTFANIDAKEMTALFGEKVFICTSEGYKWVKWTDLEKENLKHQKGQECSLCVISCGGISGYESQSSQVLTAKEVAEEFYYSGQDVKLSSIFKNGQPRSPPLLFVS